MLLDRQEAAGIDTGGAALGCKRCGLSLSSVAGWAGGWIGVFLGEGKKKRATKWVTDLSMTLSIPRRGFLQGREAPAKISPSPFQRAPCTFLALEPLHVLPFPVLFLEQGENI